MSTTIDERVVEMRFDNKQFESGVSTTMSTLDKLKQKLNLTGASKGLEDVNIAAKRVDMSGLAKGVETVSAKFSAMQVVGVTALANITNSAVNAGKRMISALTIDPVKTGFQEYETQINAVQTILANTSAKGTTIDDVNKALDELNEYADLTIYNFTEMTRNIGTFTAAGVDLDTSVNAIQGIANLAAVSGSTSQQASTAMYQLSQALAAGTVKLMDWNSVVNAGMGGEVFQNALKETSKLLGTGAEAAIKAEGSFRESLSTGWLTSEVLTETLKKFTTSGANEYVAEYTGLSQEAVSAALEEAKARYGEAEAIEYASKALAEKSGKNEEEIKSALQFAKNAEDAATKVKTFSQLWDALKESAQSGWTQTWELLVGDFEEAKNLLTPLFDVLSGIINKMSETRNAILGSALGKSFTGLVDNAKGFLKPIQESADSVKEIVDSVKDYANVVDEIIGGKWGNGQERWDKLTEAGYDWAHAQNLVNEKLGNATRHATDYAEAQNGVADAQSESAESQSELSDATIDYIADLTEMSDAQLKELGYTDEQIKAFRELAEAADKTGIPLKEFLKNIDEIDGRYLLINSFKNAGQGLVTVCKAIGEAWRKAFHGEASDEEILAKRSEKIYNLIAALHKFSTKLVVSEDTAKNITRTFKGLFAILDVITTIVGGGFKIAFKVLTSILSYFHMDILDVTASIGDIAVKFRDWFDSIFDVSKVLDVIIPALKKGIEIVKGWINAFVGLPEIQAAIKRFNAALEKLKNGIGPAFENKIEIIKKWFAAFVNLPQVQAAIKSFSAALERISRINIGDNIRKMIDSFMDLPLVQKILKHFGVELEGLGEIDLKSVGKNIVDGLVEGLKNGVKDAVVGIINLGTKLIEGICDLLGIHSPSTVFMAIGGFIIAGLIMGLKDGLISVPESLQGIVDKCLAVIQNIDWGTVFALGVSIAGIMFIKKVGDALEAFSAPFAGIGDILSEASTVVKSFGKVTKAIAFDIKTKALKNLAISLAILTGCIIAIVNLAGDDYLKMWNAVAIVGALAAVLVGLAWATSKMSDSSVKIGKDGASMEGIKQSLLTVAAAIAILGLTVKLIGSMKLGEAVQGFVGLIAIMGLMLGFLAISKKIVSSKSLKNIDKIGSLMIKMSFALGLMVGVVKLIGKLSKDEMLKGAAFAAAFVIFIGALNLVTRGAGRNVSKIGGMMIKLTIAMGLMVGVLKLVDLLSPAEMLKGAAFALAFTLFVKGLVKATTIGKNNQIAKVGGLLLAVSTSLLLMIAVCKLVGILSFGDMLKGAAFAAGFVLLVKGLMTVLTVGKDTQIAKVASTILAMSVAIGILAAVSLMLSLMSIEGLVKGVSAVAVLAAMMALMIRATKGAQNVKGALIAMTVAIALMAAAVAGLSFIEPKKLAGAVAAMAILMGMFALMTKSAKNVEKAMGTMIVMTVAIGVMAGALILLSALDVQSSLTNAAALSLLLLAVSGCMLILSKMNTSITKALTSVIALTAMAIPMVAFIGVLKLLSGVDVAADNVLALTGLMTVSTILLGILAIIGKLAGGSSFIGVLALTAMAVPLIAFVGVLAVMSNVQNAIANAETLCKMATTLTLLLIPLTIIGYLWPGAAIGIVALTAMVIPMLVFIGVLALMNSIQNATANAELLTSLMTTMTGLLTQLAIIGPMALLGVTAMAGLTLLMGAIGTMAVAVGALVDTFPGIQTFLDTGLPILEQLAGSIGTMIGKFIGGIGEGLGDSLVKIGEDIAKFMAWLQIASLCASGIDGSSFDGVKQLIEALVGVGLATVGISIADIFTGGDQTAMEKFQTDGVAFFKAIKAISAEMTGFTFPEDFSSEGLTTLMNALKSVGTAMIGLSIADFFAGGDQTAMEKFEADGIAFFKAIKGISSEMTGFTFPEDFSTEGLTTLLDALKSVGTTMLGVSIADIFASGDQTAMEKFEADGIAFFQAIKAISAEMTGFTFPEDFSSEGLTTLLDTLKTVGSSMVGVSWSDVFTLGGTSIEKFQTDGVALFTAIKAISAETSGIDTNSFSIAETAIANIKRIINSVKGIDYSGVEEFTGIGTGGFGADGPMHDIGAAIKDFSDTVTGLDVTAVDTSVTAANKIRNLIAGLTTLDTSGIDNFQVKKIGTAMKEYNGQVKGIDPEIVSSSVASANRLMSLIRSLVGIDNSGIALFNVKSIGDKMKAYSASVADIDNGAISSSIVSANKLKNFINSLAGLNASGVDSFKTAIESLGQTQIGNIEKVFSAASSTMSNVGGKLVDGIATGMRSKQTTLIAVANTLINSLHQKITSRYTAFRTAGATVMQLFATGITSQRAKVSSAASSSIAEAVSSIRDKYQSFYSAGSYLVDGFANGISENSYKAAAKAKAMAEAAKKAAQEALGIASPSKVFYKIGDYTGQGFVNALSDYGSKSYSAASEMAEYARNGLSDAISKVGEIINSDIDSQPTIRPVLDLSEVESGASAISGLFSDGTSVGVRANVNAISSMMNQNRQNGGNSDVISAIDRLRKDLGSSGSTVYNINGITYDDGSNVSGAVRELFRAAKIERRI